MDWHPWNNRPQFKKNFQDKKKNKSGVANSPSGKKQQTKPKKNLSRKKRHRGQNPRRLRDKKMEDKLPVTKVGLQDRKYKMTLKPNKTLVKPQENSTLRRFTLRREVKPLEIYAPLSSSDESEIEEMEKLCTNQLLPPLIDLTTEDDATATEDILVLSSTNLDDSVMVLNQLSNVVNKQTDKDSQQNAIEDKASPQNMTEGLTGTLKTHCRVVPDSQKHPKRTPGMKRQRSSEFLTDAIMGELLFRPSFETESTLTPNVLGIDTVIQDSHQRPAKKKRTTGSFFKQYSSPLITKQLANRTKGASWDMATRQLQRTVENNMVVQQNNLYSSVSRDETRKTATDNGAKLCSKENMDPANQLQCMAERTSPTQPIDVGICLSVGEDLDITEPISETCSEVIDLRDALSDTDSIEIQDNQNAVTENTAETCSEDIPGLFLPDIQIVSENAATEPIICDITVPKHRKKGCKTKCTSVFLPGTENTNIQNITPLAIRNEMQRCAMANSAVFNVMQHNSNTTIPNVTQFSHFNEAQKHRMAVQQMIGGGRVDSTIPRNLVPVGSLRPIVIDGSNVARTHGSATGTFSCRGIAICIEHFLARGHTQVTAFVPQFRRNLLQTDHPVTDQWMLEKLAKWQLVVFTPSRTLHRRTIASYDDRFIVDLACQTGGVIVSNDNFRDIAKESAFWRQTVEQRLLMYLFVGDIFMIPEDPFGRNGPRLGSFLSFPSYM